MRGVQLTDHLVGEVVQIFVRADMRKQRLVRGLDVWLGRLARRWPLLRHRSPRAGTNARLRLGLKQFGGLVGIYGHRVQIPLAILAIE